MVTYEAVLTVYLSLRNSYLFSLVHSVWVAYDVRRSREANGREEDSLFKSVVSHLVLSLGGGMLAAVLMGQPVSLLTNNLLLALYVLGFCLVNGTPLYEFLKATSPVSEIVMDCYMDAISRALACVFTIDSFNALVDQSVTTGHSFVGQWLIGVIASTGGGIVYNIVANNNWELNDNICIISIASGLYVYFINKPYMHFLGHALMLDDVKLLIAVFVVGFFLLRRVLNEIEASNKTDETYKAKKQKQEKGSPPASPVAVQDKEVESPVTPKKTTNSGPTSPKSARKTPASPKAPSPKKASATTTAAASTPRTARKSVVAAETVSPSKSETTAVSDDEKPVLRKRATRGRPKKIDA